MFFSFHYKIAPIELLMRGLFLPCAHGEGQIHDIWHWTDKIDSNLLVTYAHRPGWGSITCSTRPYRIELGSRVNNQGLWEAVFVVSRVVPVEGCDWLNNSVDLQEADSCYSDIGSLHLFPQERELFG